MCDELSRTSELTNDNNESPQQHMSPHLINLARRLITTTTMASPSFQTKIAKVDPTKIFFPENSHIDGTLPIITDPITESALLEAAQIIRDTDQTVAFPTETVYGLGGSALNDQSVINIYKAKNRPSDNPLITHVSSINQLNRKIFKSHKTDSSLQNIPIIYHKLIKTLWPGPLTILLPTENTRGTLSVKTTNSQPTFAVRIPSNVIARALIALSDTPIAAPSANTSTKPSPTLASHVFHDLKGKIPLILDGGPCNVGVESTVLDGLSRPPMLLRPGGLTLEHILELGGQDWIDCKVENKQNVKQGETVRTPGMKYKHYSPDAKVILLIPPPDSNQRPTVKSYLHELNEIVGQEKGKKIAILTGPILNREEKLFPNNTDIIVKHLGDEGNEIQANLFAMLREADEIDNVDVMIVEGSSEDGEGLAIMNRLKKASAGNYVYVT
ncbi:hypothetical protein NCAS_0C04260 [Naumovozyma castellii]|uniref:Threonylcarbamoyl-AMP synthase n=1 Tax=Naumovozyma castellii TaxID=27288 RepID=G0VD54_NAUCA|nr:hypothetical protein NCAS_0C04260 [Naumovozyma castellii CBS 4309]CCC69416.1 hypothetical protein NCAS_0C04260 [Naumovozyma castellii CBS 4309]